MPSSSRPTKILRVLLIAAVVVALLLGIAAGIAIAATSNIRESENFQDFKLDLPTKIYDVKGRLITEFYSAEKREMVSIKELPRYLVDAFITREDRTFYKHHGFDFKRIVSAVIGVITHTNRGGASTITQQLAGTIYADRREISVKRKLVELWWALQLERRYTKEEILEQYLNTTIMGSGGLYGVEAASKYFFGHSAREITLAESAILVIQLSSPGKYNPFTNPNNAYARSRAVLDDMVKLGYVTKQEADDSFNEYWLNFDYTRTDQGAFYAREDAAPWFSEYVRRQLEDTLYGSLDLYTDGLTVNTTLDLDQQRAADLYMKEGIKTANENFRRSNGARLGDAENIYIPIVELLGLSFDLEELVVSDSRVKSKTYEYYQKNINPTLDAMSLLFGLAPLKAMANAGSGRAKSDLEKTTVEGALVTIENDTGRITALIGGSKYDQSNQLIRATQGDNLMPGSCFKPLYYSAAIDSRKFTEGTLIYDSPVVFYNDDGTPYTPLNFKGEWKGSVLTWYALAKSMNVPSLKILDGIGFDAAIDRAATLLDITDPAEIRRTFPRVYPLGLGVIGTTPLRMARAFAVFANQGKEVTPIAIRSVEDRNGRVILEPEKDLRTQQKKKGSALQVISPQNAAVMVDMLERVVRVGTLQGMTGGGASFKYKDAQGKEYTLPAAGKTGTTQNWADAWTVGFTPYLTTAIWFGFDKPGNSLGVDQSGAVLAGDIWARYMREINRGLPYKNFNRPQTGLIEVSVCAVSGLLPTSSCSDGQVKLLFYEGTQPNKLCDVHPGNTERDRDLLGKIGDQMRILDAGPTIDSRLKIDIPSFDFGVPATNSAGSANDGTNAAGTATSGAPAAEKQDSILN
jgi:penicillin-binding protein 1A